MNRDTIDGRHLSSEEVTAYMDGAVSDKDRYRIESHLVGCQRCSDEVVAISKELRAGPSASFGRRRPMAVAAAIAAAVVGISLLGPVVWEDRARVFRGNPGVVQGGVERIQSLRPIQTVEPGADSVVFAWESMGEGAVYTLTVTDEGGDLVWRGSTEDTTLSLVSAASEIALKHEQTYFWYVDALLRNGESASTGVQLFRVMDSEQ